MPKSEKRRLIALEAHVEEVRKAKDKLTRCEVSIGAETSLLGRVIDEGDRGTLIRLDDGREIRFRLFHREELIDQAWDVLAAE